MFEKPSKLRSALIGGLVIGAISGIPGLNLINCCCCAGIVLGGMLTLHLYRQEFSAEMPPLESSDALIIGIMAGIVGAIASTMLSGLLMVLFGSVEERLVTGFMDKFLRRMEQSGSVPPDSFDELREQLRTSFAESRSIGGILRGLVFALILYPIFAMLGGLIGYGIWGRKKPPVAEPPQPM